MPGKKRYTKWVDITDDLSWDNMEDEEEDVIGGNEFFRSGGMRSNRFEMRTRPMQISSTTETFVTYDPSGGVNSNPSGSNQNPVDI
uniref:Uncharacterized protein n=1 Tax=Acrobeloides nanus TaxID=290746 RepID=A0A914DST2_9BILA